MSNLHFARSSGLLNPDKARATRVAVYGLGAVGSWASLMLSKMGCTVMGMDRDVVSIENIGPQLYHGARLGDTKALAMLSNPYVLGDCDFAAREITNAIPSCTVHVLAVDCMHTRKAIVESIERPDDLILDSRMAGVSGVLLACYADHKDWWLGTWFPPEEAEPEPCTVKATVWNAARMAAEITRLVYLHLRAELPDRTEVLLHSFGLHAQEVK